MRWSGTSLRWILNVLHAFCCRRIGSSSGIAFNDDDVSSELRWPWKQKLHYHRHIHTTLPIIIINCIVIEKIIRSQIPILIKCIRGRFPQSGSLGPRGGYSTDASDQIARYAPLIISLLCSLEWNTGELLGLFSPSSYRWLFLFSSFLCPSMCVSPSVFHIRPPCSCRACQLLCPDEIVP